MDTEGRVEQGAGKKLPKPNNIVTVPASPDKDFFRWWCIFLRPFISLTNREIDVVSSYLRYRWELSKQISDPAILDTLVMSRDIRDKVLKDCSLTLQHFYVVMGGLRKNKVFLENGINPRLVPNIRQDDNGYFQLLILFKES